MILLLVLAGLAFWTLAVALPLALLVGRAVRLRDQAGPVRVADDKAPVAERNGRTVA